MSSDELKDAEARLATYRAAELEVLTKGQEFEGEEQLKIKRGNLTAIQKAIASIKDEIREIKTRDKPDDGYTLSEVILS